MLLKNNLEATISHSKPTCLAQNGIIIKPLSWGNGHEAQSIADTFFNENISENYLGTLTHIICSDLARRRSFSSRILSLITFTPFRCTSRNFWHLSCAHCCI